MSGYKDNNHPLFYEVAKKWRDCGWSVFCPAENNNGLPQSSYRHAMKDDLIEVLNSDAIALLPGWLESRGARLEVDLGKLIDCYFYDAFTMTEIYP